MMQASVLGAPPSMLPAQQQQQSLLPLPSTAQPRPGPPVPVTQTGIPAAQQPQGQRNSGLLPTHLKQPQGLSASPQQVKEPVVNAGSRQDSHSPQPPFSQQQKTEQRPIIGSSPRADFHHSPRADFQRPPMGLPPRADFHRPPMGHFPRADMHRPPLDPGNNFRQPRPGFLSGPRPRPSFHRGPPIDSPPWTGEHLDRGQPRPRQFLHEPRGMVTENRDNNKGFRSILSFHSQH